MGAFDDAVGAIVRYLERDGLTVERSGGGDTFVVRSDNPRAFAYEPVVRLPERWLRAYLEDLSTSLGKYADPSAEALSLMQINVLEALTTDHDGHGTNYAMAVGFRRGRDGRPEFFVDQDPPGPEPLDPDSGPYEWRAERP
ncbi:MAG TPA: hypothetical protein VEZ42_14090 [Pseudonocardia sp.]|nr:hypothetical protein [Pseudonocardia sp.]